MKAHLENLQRDLKEKLETNEGDTNIDKLVNAITKLQLEINKVERLEKELLYQSLDFLYTYAIYLSKILLENDKLYCKS